MTAVNTDGSVAITITRRFNAPQQLMFDVFTQHDHLVHWWGPKGCTMPRSTIDLSIGGSYNLDMRGPNGEEWPMDARFTAYDPPNGFSFTSRLPHMPGLVIDSTIMFRAVTGGTEVTVHQSMADSDASRGALQGWSQSLDKLVDYLVTARTT